VFGLKDGGGVTIDVAMRFLMSYPHSPELSCDRELVSQHSEGEGKAHGLTDVHLVFASCVLVFRL